MQDGLMEVTPGGIITTDRVMLNLYQHESPTDLRHPLPWEVLPSLQLSKALLAILLLAITVLESSRCSSMNIYIYMLKASMNASTRMPFVPQGPHLAEENATRARGCR